MRLNFMTILYWMLFGLIAGSIAEFIAPSSQGGIVSSIILGIIGAILLGKTLMENMKHTKFRKFPKVAWELFRTGKYEQD